MSLIIDNERQFQTYEETDNNFMSTNLFDERDSLKLLEYMELVVESLPENSVRAMKSDMKTYLTYCSSKSHNPFPKCFDSAKNISKIYFSHLLSKGFARKTIERKLATVKKFYRILDLRNPLSESEAIKDHIRLKLNKLDNSKQMTPIRHSDVINTPKVNYDSNLLEIRNAMIAYVGIYSLARASECLNLKVKDIDFDESTIFIRKAKNDQKGVGRFSSLSPNTLEIINLWIKKANLQPSDYLYRKVSRYGTCGKPLSYQGLLFIYKRIASKILMNKSKQNKIGTHSLRIGAAVSLAEKGIDLAQIALAGGWNTYTMPIHYTKQAKAKLTGTANFKD